MTAFSEALAAVEAATTVTQVFSAQAQFSKAAETYDEKFLAELVDAHAATRSQALRLGLRNPGSEADQARSLPDFKRLRVRGLTRRECEVAFWISKGKRDAEIALILGCAAKTISKHVENLLFKLKSKTRLVAVRTARGWLEQPP